MCISRNVISAGRAEPQSEPDEVEPASLCFSADRRIKPKVIALGNSAHNAAARWTPRGCGRVFDFRG